MTEPRKILVTSALPYANGSIHMGHLVEYIQTDIWVRFQRCADTTCTYVCASDAHGTPIMIRAREEGITPEELTEAFRAGASQRDFADFGIDFDNYYTTHSPENEALVGRSTKRSRRGGHIYTKTIEQAYRREGRDVPAGPLRARHLPLLQADGPVRRRLRSLRQAPTRRPT
jgi:methionyl-tRNA synthetase